MEAMEGAGSFTGCCEPHAVLCSAVLLSLCLCLCLTLKALRGCCEESRTCCGLWGSGQAPPLAAWARFFGKPWAPTRQGRLESRNEAAREETGDWQGWGAGPPQEAPSQRSLRNLLCDNMTCAVCEQVAERAAKETYFRRLGLWLKASPRPLLLFSTSDVEPCRPLGIPGSTGQATFRQSAGESSFSPSIREECLLCSADWARPKDSLYSSSVSISNFSASSHKKGSSSFGQSQGQFHASPRTAVLRQQEEDWGHSSESEISPERKRDKRVSPDSNMHFPCLPPEVKTPLAATPLPFIPVETQRQLESHTGTQVIGKAAEPTEEGKARVSPPRTKMPREKGRGCLSPKVKRSPSAKTPRPSKRQDLLSEKEPPLSIWEQNYQAVQRHVAKKALETQLAVFPPVVRCSQASTSRGRKRALPKVLPLGTGVVQLRRQELPFVKQAGLEEIKLNLVHKNLAYKWGLPTLHRKSLARLFHGTTPPASRSLLPTKATAGGFPAIAGALFGGQQMREELEWHVRWKRLQHTWGLPGLVQRSLRHLLPDIPPLPQQRTGHEKVTVFQEKLSFLSRETRQKLEHNVRKRVILQHWGLPQVVLRSLRGLRPETEGPPLRGKATRSHLALPGRDFPCSSSVRASPGALADHRKARRKMPTAPHQALLCPTVHPKDLEKMAHHVAKKSVEVHLGVLPAAARRSWRLASLSRRQPLPQLISRGQRDLRPRQGFLPFVCPEDVDRIDMAVRGHHLSSLWGLGLRYVEALGGMVPKQPSSSGLTRRPPGLEFPGKHEPFLPKQDVEVLELSVRKKRLQHEWGLPALIQKSLKALMEGSPLLPARSGAATQVTVLPQELSFLPRSVLSHLEIHVQKMKLQRQWGLPQRVLESLKVLCPEAGSHISGQRVRRSPLAPVHVSHGMPPVSSPMGPQSTGQSTQEARRSRGSDAFGPCPRPLLLSPRDLEKLSLRVSKKCVEVQLGAFPTLARLSWREAALRKPLPKLIFPGRKPLQPRSHFLPFVRREDVERIELSVRHNHLRSLWGLGTRYVEAVAVMMPMLPSRSHPSNMAAFVFSEAKTPFVQEQDRETLELHVRRMRIQHTWGLPSRVQRALMAFMDKAPSTPVCTKTSILVQTHGQELPFLPPDRHRALELHIQKMKIQRRWGLPSRVLKSLKNFLSSGSLRKVRSDSRPRRSPPPPKREFPSTKGSVRSGSRHVKEAHPCLTDPPKTSVPQPAVHSQPAIKGSKTPPGGKKAVPSGEKHLKAAQLQGEGRGKQGYPGPGLVKEGRGPSRRKKNVHEKVSLIGSILDGKLHLDEGLHTWLRAQERQRALWKEKDGKQSVRGANRAERPQGAVLPFTVRWERQCGCPQVAGPATQARGKAQGPMWVQTPKAQPFRAGRQDGF